MLKIKLKTDWNRFRQYWRELMEDFEAAVLELAEETAEYICK